MKEEKGITYICSECEKEARVVFIVREDNKIKNKCQKCFYGKPETKNN